MPETLTTCENTTLWEKKISNNFALIYFNSPIIQ